MRYETKHLIVEAKQFHFTDESRHEIVKWSNGDIKIDSEGGLLVPCGCCYRVARPGDFILKNYDGEFHILDKGLFKLAFDALVC